MGILVGVLIGLLAGALAGAAVCMRLLRQEIAANIGPRLQRIELQLDSLRAEVTLDSETRLAVLRESLEQHQPRG